jgi:hypothetical protein
VTVATGQSLHNHPIRCRHAVKAVVGLSDSTTTAISDWCGMTLYQTILRQRT